MRPRVFALILPIAACQSLSSSEPPRVPVATTRAVPPMRPMVELGARTGSVIVTTHVERRLLAYVADEDDAMLRVFDIDTERELTSVVLEGKPGQIVALPHARIAVALRDVGKVAVFEGVGTNAFPFRAVASLDTPPEPIGLARSPDNTSLVVTSGWGHALTVFDVETLARRFVVDVAREPRGVAISDDGTRAFVSHAAGDALSIVKLDELSAKPKTWRLEAETWTTGFRGGEDGPFARKSNNAFTVAMSVEPAGRVFVPHGLSHTTIESSSAEETSAGYGGNGAGSNDVFDVAVIDAQKNEPMDFEKSSAGQTVRLARERTNCLIPRATAVTGSKLFVACLDTNRVIELDAGWFHPDESVTRSFAVPSGPTGLALDVEGDRVIVWSQFARKITLLPTASDGAFTIGSFAVPSQHPLDVQIAKGREIFFHQDVRVSSDGRVCGSCHPDGRDDGLVWNTVEGPRQTPMLAGRLDGSAPYGWRGSSADVPTHLKITLARLGGTGFPTDDRDALVAFVKSLPSPKARKVDQEIAKRGEAIFNSDKAGCATCHGSGGDLPDGERHNVRSWAQGDVLGLFDTPSLRSVGGTAPYFHDGRYKDLHTLLVSVDGTMGHTKYLSEPDMGALETYLRSL